MTEPTMAALDAAVVEQRNNVLEWGPKPAKFPMARLAMVEDVAALIDAAEARGAARERQRECVWVVTDAHHQHTELDIVQSGCPSWMERERGDLTTFCASCGGRVRVEEASDD